MRRYLIPAVLALGIGAIAPASAATTYLLNVISDPNIGSGSQGTVALTQNGANEVDVMVTLASGVLLVNTGGPHTPFAFNLATPKAGSTVTVTSVNTPATFSPESGPVSATPYGTYTNGIAYNGSNGGVGHGSAGPLSFKVVNLAGLSISDFIANSLGYFFAADVYGTGGNTGTVASNAVVVSSVPLPATLPLLASGLGALALLARRRKQKQAAV